MKKFLIILTIVMLCVNLLLIKDTSIVSQSVKTTSFLLNIILLLITILFFLGKRKSKQNTYFNVKLKDINGDEEFLNKINIVSYFLKMPKKLYNHKLQYPKGVILYGTSKDDNLLTMKAIAGEAGVPILRLTRKDIVEMYNNNNVDKLQELINKAKKEVSCIIHLDGIHFLSSKAGISKVIKNYTQWNVIKYKMLKLLLYEINNFDSSIVIAITAENLEDLDPVLIKNNNFYMKIKVELLEKEKVSKQILDKVATSIENFLQKNIEKKERAIIENLKKEAIHEAGHLLVNDLLMTKNNDVIKSYDNAYVKLNKERNLNKEHLIRKIKILYAGKAAENILLTNYDEEKASEDFKEASKYIHEYLEKYGAFEFGLSIKSDKGLYNEKAINLSEELYLSTEELIKENKDKLEATVAKIIDNKKAESKNSTLYSIV